MFYKNSRIFIILVVIILIFSKFVSSQDDTDKRESDDNNNERESSTHTTTTATKHSMSTDENEPIFKSLPDFLSSIKFYFEEPQNSTIINSNSLINIRWKCNDVNLDNKYTIKLVLQSLNQKDSNFTSGDINLNNREYKYPVFALNNNSTNYVLKVYSPDLPEKKNYYDGPILVNGNNVDGEKAKSLNVSEVNQSNDNENGSEMKTRILLIVMISLLIIAIIAVVVLYIRSRKKRLNENRNLKEYKEYKGYSNVTQSVNELLEINKYYNPNQKQVQNQKQIQSQKQAQILSSNSNTSNQSINTLAEQIHKAEQVYSNKVFGNQNLNENDDHCAPLVDMSSLYKSTQEILNKKLGTSNDDINPENYYYHKKATNQNQRVNNNTNTNNNNDNNNDKDNYGIVNSEVDKNEESFLVIDNNSSKSKANSISHSDSSNSNSNNILAQSVSYSMALDPDNGEQVPLYNPMKILNENNNFEEEESNTTDEDYLNKNSFCLSTSRDSIDAFENIYLNKQNEHLSDKSSMNQNNPLVATITTVEEYLEAHRNSKEIRHARSSSLLSTNSSSSLIENSNVNGVNVPNMNVINSSKLNLTNAPKSSPLKLQENYNSEAEKSDNMNRRSGSDYNSSSVVLESAMNSSIIEEINSLEDQIQQEKQQMFHTQHLNSPLLQGNLQSQDIDPNQLNLQMANLQQQGIEGEQYLPSFPLTKSNNKYSVPISTPLRFIATSAQGKSLAMTSPSHVTSPQFKALSGSSSPSHANVTSPQFKGLGGSLSPSHANMTSPQLRGLGGSSSPYGQIPIPTPPPHSKSSSPTHSILKNKASPQPFSSNSQVQSILKNKASPQPISSNSQGQSILKGKVSPQSLNSPYLKSSQNGKMLKTLRNGGVVGGEMLSDNILQKSQESESTLQVQQGTQDSVSMEGNDDEVETIVATHVCNAWYSPNMPDELRMCPGDELIILERFNDGWGFGQNTKGSVGVFPLNCVTYIDYNNTNNNNNRVDNNNLSSIPNNLNNEININQNNGNGNYTNYNNYNNYNNNIDINDNSNQRMKKRVSFKSNSNLNENIQPNKAKVFDTNNLYDYDDVNDLSSSGIDEYYDYLSNSNISTIPKNQPHYQINYRNSPNSPKNMIKNGQNKYGGVPLNNNTLLNQYY